MWIFGLGRHCTRRKWLLQKQSKNDKMLNKLAISDVLFADPQSRGSTSQDLTRPMWLWSSMTFRVPFSCTSFSSVWLSWHLVSRWLERGVQSIAMHENQLQEDRIGAWTEVEPKEVVEAN